MTDPGAPGGRWVRTLAEWLDWSQGNLVDAVRATDPSVVRRRVGPTAPSIAFHAWHMARWADKYQAAIPGWLGATPSDGSAEEIWTRDGVVERWGLAGGQLGDYGGTGAGLDDDASSALPLPEVEEILQYMGAAFGALTSRVLALTEADLDREIVDLYDEASTIGDAVLSATSHTDRHLGMIEALRGVLGEHGTVTV